MRQDETLLLKLPFFFLFVDLSTVLIDELIKFENCCLLEIVRARKAKHKLSKFTIIYQLTVTKRREKSQGYRKASSTLWTLCKDLKKIAEKRAKPNKRIGFC